MGSKLFVETNIVLGSVHSAPGKRQDGNVSPSEAQVLVTLIKPDLGSQICAPEMYVYKSIRTSRNSSSP